MPLQEVLTAISTAISTVGFPIAACVALFWFNYKQTELHREETQKLSETINNNTVALTKLSEKIQHLEEVKNNG